MGHHEAGGLHALLDGVPDGVPGVVKDHRHPAPGLEHPAILLEAALHQLLVFGQALLLGFVHDRLGRGVGAHAVPGLHEEVEVGVVDVLAEGGIGEDVVNRFVGNIQSSGGAGGNSGKVLPRFSGLKRFGETIDLDNKIV